MKTYLPKEFINSNYHYKINNDYYTIITNENCHIQYSTTYCNCFNLYPKLDYITSEVSSCSLSSSNNYVSYESFTDDVWYRIDIDKSLIIFCVLFLFVICLPYKIMSRIFGRWLKI